jgi:hypothetical protein
MPEIINKTISYPNHIQCAGETFEASTLDFVRDLVDLFGGPRHSVRIGVIESCEAPLIEISGKLPRAARGGLKRAFATWERMSRGGRSWDEAWAVWHLSRDGYGPRFAIPSLGALCDVLVARRRERPCKKV